MRSQHDSSTTYRQNGIDRQVKSECLKGGENIQKSHELNRAPRLNQHSTGQAYWAVRLFNASTTFDHRFSKWKRLKLSALGRPEFHCVANGFVETEFIEEPSFHSKLSINDI